MGTLLIDLLRIPETGLAVRLSGEPEQLFPEGDREFTVLTPSLLMGELIKLEEQVIFRGELSTELEMTCSRCLEAFHISLHLSVGEILFLPWTAEQEKEVTESVSEEGALDIYYYRENRLDFCDLMHDQICLAIPLKPLCKESCQGLCVHCGQNLNLAQCTCKEEQRDPRFEILKKLQRS